MGTDNFFPLNPTMVDAVIKDLADGLKENIGWLDSSFGKAERVTRVVNNKTFRAPAVYSRAQQRENDYLELLPDSKIGNFSFFYVMDPEEVVWREHARCRLKVPIALIFWFDLRKIYNSLTDRDTEALKKQIIDVINGEIRMKHGSITITRIYNRAENIYREFTIDEIDNQFLMHPYSGFRFEGYLYYEMPC